MALRKIVKTGDPALTKVCRPVEKFDEKLHQLLDDMGDTMYEADGVGLAAPQIGILRRIYVIDAGQGLMEFINPEIIDRQGTQEAIEGCLSCPEIVGITQRPAKVTVRALARLGKPFTVTGEEMFARALCHEYDHLDGNTFYQTATQIMTQDQLEETLARRSESEEPA